MLKDGIYEQILNQEILDQLEKIDPKTRNYQLEQLNADDSRQLLTIYLSQVIRSGLHYLRDIFKSGEDKDALIAQIRLANSIVDQVAHVHEEPGLRIPFPGILGQSGPVTVVAGLGVGEDQQLIAGGPGWGSMELMPLTFCICTDDAILIIRIGLQTADRGAILIARIAIIGKGFVYRLGRPDILTARLAVFYGHIRKRGIGFPHDTARISRCTRDDLAYIACMKVA